jgi:ribose 5-phosphate isomerase B
MERIIIGADHAGYALKEALKTWLTEHGIEVVDAGTDSSERSVDYPDFAAQVARAVSNGLLRRGILICGTGVGMSIVANRFTGVRAALCRDEETARLSRMHNDANILVLAARQTDAETAIAILRIWLSTPFEGERHQRRLDKIRETESRLSGKATPEIQ